MGVCGRGAIRDWAAADPPAVAEILTGSPILKPER